MILLKKDKVINFLNDRLPIFYLYLYPRGGWSPKRPPCAEATSWAQCTTPTDLKVDRTSWKLSQTSRGETNGYHSRCLMKQYSLQGFPSIEALKHCTGQWDRDLSSSSWQRGHLESWLTPIIKRCRLRSAWPVSILRLLTRICKYFLESLRAHWAHEGLTLCKKYLACLHPDSFCHILFCSCTLYSPFINKAVDGRYTDTNRWFRTSEMRGKGLFS